ncbi:MAG: tetratricopeptide repeat protein [Methanomicrobiales archaeon]|nr:tetratricopeptide repeat protein [Methanomicrobiales archaeon]
MRYTNRGERMENQILCTGMRNGNEGRVMQTLFGTASSFGGSLRTGGSSEMIAARICRTAPSVDPQTQLDFVDPSGRYREALVLLDADKDASDPRVWEKKGYCHDNLRQYEDALCCYDRAIALAPRFARAWNNKGITLGKMGRYAEAVRCFDRAIEIAPQYVRAWHNRTYYQKIARYCGTERGREPEIR